jgi:CotH kinase protein/Chitobiase/beta-hexosaminidase C-terminal domain/Lamin Tail Domain/Secretion system C-terminal sorting domain
MNVKQRVELAVLFVLIFVGGNVYSQAQILLSEIQITNGSTIADEDGDYGDWVEVWNAGNEFANLQGYALSDDPQNLQKWIFPQWTIGPNERVVVFASAKNRFTDPLHTNFKLNADETLLLSNANSEIIVNVQIPALQLGHVLQTNAQANAWCIATVATPNAPNALDCANGYETKPVFELESGVFTGTQIVQLTTINPNAEIRYTTDGSLPNAQSTLYTAPLAVDATVTISARCFSSTALPSMAEKNTYLINEWQIDIPIVSISTDPYNLWDSLYGIHVFGPPDYGGYPYFGANFWENWERESYMEYFDADHVKQIEGPVGLKIHGGWSRGNDQKSFRVQCKDQYGMESMDYPMMADKPFITSFKGFNLRNGGNDYWGPRFHDALMQRTLNGTHADYMGYTPVVVFLNGEYWGFMEMREVEDQHWVENNHGINSSDATVISYNYMGLNVINGSDESFFEMLDFALNTDPQSDEFFPTISAMLNIENYADYIIAETYYCNGDWSNGWINNTKFWHDDTPSGKWNFLLMDLDFGMGLAGNGPNDNYIVTAGDEGWYTDQLFSRIIQNETFRKYFINRYADLMNSAFQPERVNAIGNAMRDEISPIFERHCQRWGTDFSSLQWAVDGRLDWNEQRVGGSRNVVQNHFGLENQVTISLDVVPAGAGRIHISTIEPQESEYPWSGVYYNGVPVKITVVPNPGFTFHHWAPNGIFPTALYVDQFITNFQNNESFTAYFEGESADNAVVVSEFMYNDDAANESGDWIELHNNLDVPLDLSSMYIKDANYFNRYNMPLNLTIAPNEYVVIAENLELFQAQYPNVAAVVGPLGFSLNNANDEIILYDYHNTQIINISYSDDAPWPTNSDGTGRTNEYNLMANNQNLASNWVAGCLDGSPAEEYDPNCGLVGINEFTLGNSDVLLYPTPATNVLNVQLNTRLDNNIFTYELIDAQGHIVIKESLNSIYSIIDVEPLAAGMYVMRIFNNNFHSSIPFVVE